ncbi:hypothetical protein MKQ68_20165 [Chitinophaga horti]|uniref:Hedgehog protein Hint domain-containing protein n=1 Tax=Chitinophaga horti TaxID=2920382 RepID=A0ABY6J2L3_9BACT|nr:hypothetical protein [Chitinophaga horti]UYQ92402.1 hypothetical protein MKQ68_20165 [Chitinophaga horti]
MRKLVLLCLLVSSALSIAAQDKAARPVTMEEYEKAKKFTVKDLDNDTYAKFENTYVLDRYELRKPYYITGDDGLKKRVDIYKLLLKEGMQDLGTIIFYTNEKGKLYTALIPNFTADAKVWNKYFEDIHAIDKEEKNYVLKLSYILSKECSFQLYKAQHQGKDLKDESGTYGSDICFPGTQQVAMADGSQKLLRDVRPGDRIVTVDPATNGATTVTVKELTTHEAKNYAITQLLLLSANEKETASAKEVQLSVRLLEATPNHPMTTAAGRKKIGDVGVDEEVLCRDEQTGEYRKFTVVRKTEKAGGTQAVYNIVADGGSTFLMNGVMVLQK